MVRVVRIVGSIRADEVIDDAVTKQANRDQCCLSMRVTCHSMGRIMAE